MNTLRGATCSLLPHLLRRCPASSTTTLLPTTSPHILTTTRSVYTIKWLDLPPPSQKPPRPSKYQLAVTKSIEDPNAFWGDNAKEEIHWDTKWSDVYDGKNWFVGGETNASCNALDYHIRNGYGISTAIIFDSPVTKTVERITYAELLHKTMKFAGVLKAKGVQKGDRVVIFMPQIPEAIIAMLACARIGAVHSVVFGGLGAPQLAARIAHSKAKCVISASGGIEHKVQVEYKPKLDAAIELSAHKPDFTITFQRPNFAPTKLIPDRDFDWATLLVGVAPVHQPEPLPSSHPLYILYTSGTTGEPKGVTRDHGGHTVALKWAMRNLMGLRRGSVFWAASDIGWVVGHSFSVYGPLFLGATTILYEGKPVGTPDAGAYWRVIADHKVTALFSAPTALRAIRREDPNLALLKKHDISTIKHVFLAGEHADPDTIEWLQNNLKVLAVDNWWQTETGWPICTNPVGLVTFPVKPGSCTKPAPGFQVAVLDEAGAVVGPGKMGELVIKLPLPPGVFTGLYENEPLYKQTYFDPYPGYFKTGDAGYIDADGYVWVMSRTDDVLNVAGHRFSAGAFEEVVSAHSSVAECAVIGTPDSIKGEIPIALVILKNGETRPKEEIAHEIINKVRHDIGAVAALKHVVFVDRLPKTRSGKILRATIRKVVKGEEFVIPATIEDPASLDDIKKALQQSGLISKTR